MGNTRKKVSVIGAGFTGATTAFLIAQKSWQTLFLLIFRNWRTRQREKRLICLKQALFKALTRKLREHPTMRIQRVLTLLSLQPVSQENLV